CSSDLYAKMLKHAPLAIIPCGDLDKALEGDGQAFWIQDVSAATENMLIAANALGVGAVWTAVYPDESRIDAVRKVLGMPASIMPLAVVPMGYPAGEHHPKDKWKPENIHYNGW
ncbi:nitroreductase family protein, partial [uncultured Muribaculum sp.]|uniref:nitroreductase family protein n=1 Tax=uncultured Muribaculum sp. TaxID=1918613 RepID=UPI0026E56607